MAKPSAPAKANGATRGLDRALQLKTQEEIIRRGDWIDKADALTVIQAGRLYREAGKRTFDEYLDQNCGMSRQFGYDHLHGAAVIRNVRWDRTRGPLPLMQVATLYGLEPAQQVELIERIHTEH